MNAVALEVRRARVTEAPAIAAIVNRYALQGLMLPKRVLDVYQSIREYVVAVAPDGTLLGCGALRILGNDLAEVRSLAIHEDAQGRGLGRRLVEALAEEARSIGLTRIFALTLQVEFFARLGFQVVDKAIFPQKVWLDCRHCPKRTQCDETAMELML